MFHWLVVGCNNTNEEVVFTSVPFFLFDITFFSVHLYIIKKNCGTPTNTYPTTSEASTKKKLPMDYNNVNRWYNIGIKPYMDYMETFQSYPTITATI